MKLSNRADGNSIWDVRPHYVKQSLGNHSIYMTGASEQGLDHAALCTSHPEVQKCLTESVASICRAVQGLAGFFTITGSENLTNCWSHGGGGRCRRCGKRSPAEDLRTQRSI